jgi:hypothetical protein
MAELTGATPELTVSDAFGWAARDPDWLGKLLLMGLIGLIPVVGGLQQSGWLLTMLDNLRAGRYDVPPAAFRYATRGVWLWLTGVIYALVLVFIFYGVFFVFVFGTSAAGAYGAHDHNPGPLTLLFFPFFFLWFGFVGVLSIAIWIFVPAVIQLVDRRGLAGGFDFAGIFHALRSDPQHNLAAAGLTFVAYFISGLGVYVCWVGLIFTAPYALTVLAGVLRWYEANVKPGALPPPIVASAR